LNPRSPLIGHSLVRAALARAAHHEELPGSLLLHGPPGVGKQRLGLWLAQLLLCEAASIDGPCETCRSCRSASRLEHPDLHWFFPLPRPKGASGSERLAEALEEARGVELAARRVEPDRIARNDEAISYFVAQVHTVRKLSGSRPAVGRRKVFLIGDAELLVPQESSPEAANAFLKLLEEPPPDTTFIVTASDPDALLPTIRSRLLPIRMRPLDLEAVATFLTERRGLDASAALSLARLAEGSIGRALAFLPTGGADGPLQASRAHARGLLTAVADSPRARLAAAHATSAAGARGAFSGSLDFLALWLRDLAALANGAEDQIINRDSIEFLRSLPPRLPAAAHRVPDALRVLDEARGLARGNVNPQLTVAWLLRRLHETLSVG